MVEEKPEASHERLWIMLVSKGGDVVGGRVANYPAGHNPVEEELEVCVLEHDKDASGAAILPGKQTYYTATGYSSELKMLVMREKVYAKEDTPDQSKFQFGGHGGQGETDDLTKL